MASVTRRGKNGRAGRGTVEGHIFEAVERLLAAGESFTAVGVQRIADEAGIARSSFYLNFADKVDLLMRLSDAATRDLFAIAEAWVEDRDRSLEGLEIGITEVIGEYRAHAGTLAAVTEVAAYDGEVAAHWQALVDRFAAVWEDAIAADQRAGRAPADLDVPATVRFVAWGIERAVARHIADERPPSEDAAVATALARATWAAFYARRTDLP
ncbi:TetR/AcrR family transcriptional regulator [Patulibacter brassicae]|uniref:TetR/AcrR family transcriptional regulator n=1 Tax=Patulibacter brassicae TaxID=1705717 RepID=A0ABU4VKK0_9ACTN|nr:TetR/AcrR family transcriptional regulator [Patulibacter brassicae]MDX8152391.1 TetR/AcrR family transcriptional regulator [Patulibacter brassicae]